MRRANRGGAGSMSGISVVPSHEEAAEVRTRPLPNRHAHDLSLFTETIQATLNKPVNRVKGPLEDMNRLAVHEKIIEESNELYESMLMLEDILEATGGVESDVLLQAIAEVEHEAADVAVIALAGFVKARTLARDLARKGVGNG